MGEVNPDVAAQKPQLIELDFPYTAARNPAVPACSLEAFLEQYSRSGGTHHSALVYGERIEAVRAFGAFAGINVTVI